jgi:hypothetical protein
MLFRIAQYSRKATVTSTESSDTSNSSSTATTVISSPRVSAATSSAPSSIRQWVTDANYRRPDGIGAARELLGVAPVDGAEKVVLRIRKHHEVGILRVVPLDLHSAEGNESIRLGDLLLRTSNVQIEVHART